MPTINIGERCELTICKTGVLVLTERHSSGFVISSIPLGRATSERIQGVREFLDQLSKHAIEK